MVLRRSFITDLLSRMHDGHAIAMLQIRLAVAVLRRQRRVLIEETAAQILEHLKR